PKRSPERKTTPARAPRSTSATRLTFKETRELEAIPGRIAVLEQEQEAITRELADPVLYREQPERVSALQERYAAVEEELMHCLARWEELEGRQKEEGRKQKG
ncbi:MAG TPA: ABC transporter ATP-binding protein, partial [Burkholderiales bacterium]|nr:ABC transporter ATP-binding protein [Burkholderiales bacterium]